MPRNPNGTTHGQKILVGMIKDDAFRSADAATEWLKQARCSDGQISLVRALIDNDMIRKDPTNG